VLVAAIVIFVVATLAGLLVFARSALHARGRLERLEAARSTALELVARGQELRTRAEALRADTERLRAIAGLFG
jgi:hypothetical protein